ncbi:hypothetical protein KGM48_01150 [Patescibacteria group bacterium]|nr:hypothetical protein [Patescibacteria group bacterium]
MALKLKIEAHIELPEIARKTTLDCFVNARFRDEMLDCELPVVQTATAAAKIIAVSFNEEWDDRDVAYALIGLDRKTDRISCRTLGNLLIALDHTLTLPQAEAVLTGAAFKINDARIRGEQTYHCFVVTGDPQNPVAVCAVRVCYDWEEWMEDWSYSVDLLAPFLGDQAGSETCHNQFFLVPNFVRRYAYA